MVASAPVTMQFPPPLNRAAAMTESSLSHSSVVALGPTLLSGIKEVWCPWSGDPAEMELERWTVWFRGRLGM